MADVKISELSTASVLQETDNIELSQIISGVLQSSKTTLLSLADKVASNTNYTSALNTTDKTLTGAINEKTQAEAIAQVEVNPSANNYAIGDYLMYNGVLYKVIVAITSGENLVVGTNITAVLITDEMSSGGGGGAWTDITGTLTAGQTSITLTSNAILTTSTIDYYTDVFGVNPINAVVTTGQIVLTFEARSADLSVKVRVS